MVGGGAKGFKGDGEAVQSLLVGPFGLSFDGSGTLSLSSVMVSTDSAETTIKSRTPGRITVQASAIGAWGVTASIDVKAIRSLAASADPLTISANGFDTSVFALKLLDLDGS